MLSTFLFDLDGTLLDSQVIDLGIVHVELNKALESCRAAHARGRKLAKGMTNRRFRIENPRLLVDGKRREVEGANA